LYLARYGTVLPKVKDRFTGPAEINAVATFLVATGAVNKTQDFDLQVKAFCANFKSHIFAKALIATKTKGEIQVTKITPSKELSELRQDVRGLQALVRENKARIDQLESRSNEIIHDTGNVPANTPKDAGIQNPVITLHKPDEASEGNALRPSTDSPTSVTGTKAAALAPDSTLKIAAVSKTADETSEGDALQPFTNSPTSATRKKAAADLPDSPSNVDAVAANATADANKKRPPPESDATSNAK
jgi:hypothetical protein